MRPGQLRRTPFRPVPVAADGTVRWSSFPPRESGIGRGAPLAVRDAAKGSGLVTASTIPPDVLKLVDARDEHTCIRCGREREVIEHHHRRIKGSGGDTRAHTECACCILSLCPWWAEPACHAWAHRNRVEAEAEGLIIPRSAEFPFLYPVLVHERYDAGGQLAWPTCDGRWDTSEPEGSVA